MLTRISCDKLVEKTITFGKGLNVLEGSSVADNSIGKSSVLMLVDFIFGGNDFTKYCDDVIDNVGQLSVEFEFKFGKDNFVFNRNTESKDSILFINNGKTWSYEEYKDFLGDIYGFSVDSVSFRDSVNGFSRIWHKENYDHKKPLHSFSQDSWEKIQRRILKLFDKYSEIKELEELQKESKKRMESIKGAFASGAVKKITKNVYMKNKVHLDELDSKMSEIKNALKKHVSDINKLINEKSIALKNDKDKLQSKKRKVEAQLHRIEQNISSNTPVRKSYFNKVAEFFPAVDLKKIEQVEGFHNGISKILRLQLKQEAENLKCNIEAIKDNISIIDDELSMLVDSKEEPTYLLDNLLELDRRKSEKEIQNEYWDKNYSAKEDVSDKKQEIKNNTKDALEEIEKILNKGLKKHVSTLYLEQPIIPCISLGETNYKFEHGDDRGTGKCFANLISLDLTFLEETYLPFVIHDSYLLKNIEQKAIENLIGDYDKFDKQIFISIDEISKYSRETQKLIKKNRFLKLNKDRLAFRKQWKKEQ